MHVPFFARDNTQCPAGTQYYTCAASNYKGCCVVDACDYDDGCPSGLSTAAPTTSTTTSTATSTSSSPPRTSTSTTSSTSTRETSTTSSTSPAHSSSSTTSSTSTKTTSTPTATAAASSNGDQGASSHALSKGAIGGIVTAGVIAFVVLFCIFLWRWRKRNKALEAQAAALAAGAALGPGGMSAQSPHPSAAPSPGFLGTTPPGLPQGSPTPDEKIGRSVSQSESLLMNDVNNLNGANGGNNNLMVNAKVAEPGTSATATIPLFGEAPSGNTEESIKYWGLHGARLAAQRRAQMYGSVSSADHVDYGGSFLGPGGEQVGVAPPPLQGQPDARLAELDGQRTSIAAELETPQPTPFPTPLSTPGMSSYSPSLSGTGTVGGGRSTVVSSWRDSSRTVASNSDSNIIAEETAAEVDGTGARHIITPELHGTPRMPSALPSPTPSVPSILQQPAPPHPHSPTRSGSTTEAPRATLDISQTERVRGVHVASWGSYNP